MNIKIVWNDQNSLKERTFKWWRSHKHVRESARYFKKKRVFIQMRQGKLTFSYFLHIAILFYPRGQAEHSFSILIFGKAWISQNSAILRCLDFLWAFYLTNNKPEPMSDQGGDTITIFLSSNTKHNHIQ